MVWARQVQLLAIMTKLGWMDLEDHQQILLEVSRFLQATPAHLILGLQILQQLVTEVMIDDELTLEPPRDFRGHRPMPARHAFRSR